MAASVVDGQLATGTVPVAVNKSSVIEMPFMVTLPELATTKE